MEMVRYNHYILNGETKWGEVASRKESCKVKNRPYLCTKVSNIPFEVGLLNVSHFLSA